MTTRSVLIVDDEPDIRELVEITLARMGLRTDSAASLAEARQLMARQEFDVCITDMRLPDGSGISLVAEIQQRAPQTPVAVITAYGNAEAAVESLKAGAFDFVSKPVDVGVLRKLVDTALRLRGPSPGSGTGSGLAPVPQPGQTAELLGEHESIRQLRSLVERLARSQAPVHITGESGTGKELVARLIHERGPRAASPFVAVNCGAIPNELMESEFFGHLKGSFTGAHRDKPGLFQAAEGGTLFLDEVAELPIHMQVKLLRALQERRVRPVGAEAEAPVNVRVISATHRDLGELVQTGRFRQDLFYRLDVIAVRTPALRERPGDVPVLARHILDRIAASAGLREAPTVDPAAFEALSRYSFPGNVRELENILERALTLCDGVRIRVADLQLRAPSAVADSATGLEHQKEELERQAIREALHKTRFNKTRAAELLGMSFRSLRYRIKKLGIDQE